MAQQGYMHHQGSIGVLPSPFGCRLNVHPGSDWSVHTSDSSQRFRRRLDKYRHKHNGDVAHYENWTSSVSEDERTKITALRQRWLDSRSKRLSATKTKNPVSCPREDTTAVYESKVKRRLTNDVNINLPTECALVPSKSNATLDVVHFDQHGTNLDQQHGKKNMPQANTSSSKYAAGDLEEAHGQPLLLSQTSKFTPDNFSKQEAHTSSNSHINDSSTAMNESLGFDIDLGDLSDLCLFMDGASSDNTDFVHILNQESSRDIPHMSDVDNSIVRSALADRNIKDGTGNNTHNIWGGKYDAHEVVKFEGRRSDSVAVSSSCQSIPHVERVVAPVTSLECSKGTLGMTGSSTQAVRVGGVAHHPSSSNLSHSYSTPMPALISCHSIQISGNMTPSLGSQIFEQGLPNGGQYEQLHSQKDPQNFRNLLHYPYQHQWMPEVSGLPEYLPMNHVFFPMCNDNQRPVAMQSNNHINQNQRLAPVSSQQESDTVPPVMQRNFNNFSNVADVGSAARFKTSIVHNVPVMFDSVSAISHNNETSVRSSASLYYGRPPVPVTVHASNRQMQYVAPSQPNWSGFDNMYVQYPNNNPLAPAHNAGQLQCVDGSHWSPYTGGNYVKFEPTSSRAAISVSRAWRLPCQQMVRQQAIAVTSPITIQGSGNNAIRYPPRLVEHFNVNVSTGHGMGAENDVQFMGNEYRL